MSEARRLTAALGGRWYGSYGMASCPAHDDRLPSLSLRNGEAGVLLYCHAGCEARDVIGRLRTRGLWHGRTDRWTLRSRLVETTPRSHGRDESERIAQALRILGGTAPAPGTVAGTYLRDARGVWTGTIPDDIHYAPNLPHPTGGRHPAMVCAVRGPDGAIGGIHRTWLLPDGSGKAEVVPQKAMLGRCAGGAVRLAPAGEEVQVTEGVETGLAVFTETGVPTWAALSTSGLRGLVLPPMVRRVVICADGDDAGEAAAQAAAQRWLAEGRSIRIARPPGGTDFADFAIPANAHAQVAKAAKVAAGGGAP